MLRAEDTVLVLLAAGRSSRFGAANKLEAEFLGKPVGMHVVTALEAVPFRDRYAIVDSCRLDYAARGYRVIENHDPDAGQSQSLKLGVAAVRGGDAKAVLVALADMPRVTATHVLNLLAAADGDDTVVASSDGVKPCPPALFGAGRFDFLMSLEGDAGARDLVKAGRHVVTTPAELIDIDTPADLESLRERVHSWRSASIGLSAAARRAGK